MFNFFRRSNLEKMNSTRKRRSPEAMFRRKDPALRALGMSEEVEEVPLHVIKDNRLWQDSAAAVDEGKSFALVRHSDKESRDTLEKWQRLVFFFLRDHCKRAQGLFDERELHRQMEADGLQIVSLPMRSHKKPN